MANNRIQKINSEIMRALSDTINNRLKDPRVSGIISVIDLKTSADLKHADVFISIFNADKEKTSLTFDVLNKSAGFIRSELARTLKLRTIPMLHFKSDDSMEYSQKITEIIKGISNDEK